MKIIESLPPNFEAIVQVFPDVEEMKAIFCFGKTIFNPFGVNVTPDLIEHEQVHSRQQGASPDQWWYNYLTDPSFRLEQEIEAYGTQLAFAKRCGVRGAMFDWLKGKLASSLSSKLYGNLISYQEAESRIRHYAKRIEY